MPAGRYYRSARRWVVPACLLVCALLDGGCTRSGGSAGADDDEWTRGPIRIIVGLSAGGLADLQARLLANALGRHLPGAPAVVVQNMPGAGGLVAANYLARQARPDGRTLGYIGPQTVLAQLIGEPGASYDARQFAPIGALESEDVDICVMTRGAGIDIANWRTRASPPRIGITVRGSANHLRAVVLSSALGLPVRPVVGYPGMAEIRLAMESGEVEGACIGWGSFKSLFEPVDRYSIVLQTGHQPSLSAQGVPSAEDVVSDARGRSLLELLASLRALDRYAVAPPQTPADRVDVLRAAFDATMRDEAFLAAARQARLEIRPSRAAAIQASVENVLNASDERRREIAKLLAEKGN